MRPFLHSGFDLDGEDSLSPSSHIVAPRPCAAYRTVVPLRPGAREGAKGSFGGVYIAPAISSGSGHACQGTGAGLTRAVKPERVRASGYLTARAVSEGSSAAWRINKAGASKNYPPSQGILCHQLMS